jgi:hypothetical protein
MILSQAHCTPTLQLISLRSVTILSFHFGLKNASFPRDKKGKVIPVFDYAPCSPRKHTEN